MGRGLGPLQRRILDYLSRSRDGHMAIELELGLFDHATRGQEVSLRRAIAALERRGLVQTGYDVIDPGNLALFVWLPRSDSPLIRPSERRRWRGQDDAILDALRRITRDDVATWLAAGHGARAYPRGHPVRRQSRSDEPPLVPYQLAVQRTVGELGGRTANGRLMPSTSRALRHAFERLASRRLIALHGASESKRKYSMLQCL